MSAGSPPVGTGQSGSTSAQSYGIKYKLDVTGPSGDVLPITDSSFEPEALRLVFNVYTPMWRQYWWADIDVYNFDLDTALTLLDTASNIAPGMTVTLRAGFQNGNYDIIWQGPVFQATFTRENVTDYKLTLHCILGLLQATNGQVISSVYSGFNQSEVVESMVQALGLQLAQPLAGISTKRLWKDKVVIGNPATVLNGIAKDNSQVWFLTQRGLAGSNTGLVFSSLGNGLDTSPGWVYTPTTGLIGTPVQTTVGVDCSVLLDPRVQAKIPVQTFGIDQAVIQQAALQPNQPLVKPLQSTGTYVVLAVRHRGDSRGNIWQTDITGCVPDISVLDQLVAASA
jgi:hypothetical protein